MKDRPHFEHVQNLDTSRDSAFAMPTPKTTDGPDRMTLEELREEFFEYALDSKKNWWRLTGAHADE